MSRSSLATRYVPASTNNYTQGRRGYKICKMSVDNGWNRYSVWTIWKPNGNVYMHCNSYDEAYELATNLKPEVID